jgi:hypothetical protein
MTYYKNTPEFVKYHSLYQECTMNTHCIDNNNVCMLLEDGVTRDPLSGQCKHTENGIQNKKIQKSSTTPSQELAMIEQEVINQQCQSVEKVLNALNPTLNFNHLNYDEARGYSRKEAVPANYYENQFLLDSYQLLPPKVTAHYQYPRDGALGDIQNCNVKTHCIDTDSNTCMVIPDNYVRDRSGACLPK